MPQGDLIRIWSKSTSVLDNMVGKSGGEQDDLNGLWEQPRVDFRSLAQAIRSESLLFDPSTLISKTLLIQHIVGLVKDKNFDLVCNELAAFDHVHSSSRGTDNDLNPKTVSTAVWHLRWDCDSRCQPLDEAPHDLNNSQDLTGQLATWRKHKSLRGGKHGRRIVKT